MRRLFNLQKTNDADRLFDVSDKIVVVVGGARGIGLGIAKKFSALKARVVIVDINWELANEAVNSIKQDGGAATFLGADISVPAEIEEVMSEVAQQYGGMDVLVNSAAPIRSPQHVKAPNLFSMDDWDYEMNVLVKAQACLARTALPYLATAKGNVVNLSSIAGSLVTHQNCAYHAAKGAVDQLTRYLAFEFGVVGVRVNAISPGLVERESGPTISDDSNSATIIDQIIPLKRAATSSDIANVAVFLSTSAGSYITGQSIVIDGGLSLGEQFGVAKTVMGSS